ncbi:acetyltransferase [Shewanella sp. M16]|uniref:acetyltransferase n=1 Tax=Shewanella sp. M16 TaxID=2830837 RepID=UPI001BB02237|nr:acetyltransferase [Shewanella sp. M16]MBS0043579.1 acetyltransferase [Shewanella sp. M16]
MTKCAILGASGHGKVIAEIAELTGYKQIHFFDDRWPEIVQVEHWQVIGSSTSLLSCIQIYDLVFIAIGDNTIRLQKQQELMQAGGHFGVLVHPSAAVSTYSVLDIGTVVMANAVVNPFAEIGKACIVNTASTIDHDCVVADGVHLSPGANLAGGVMVGALSWIGIGASVKQLVSIGRNAVVGAGAAVLMNVSDNQTVVGVPAKPISRKG